MRVQLTLQIDTVTRQFFIDGKSDTPYCLEQLLYTLRHQRKHLDLSDICDICDRKEFDCNSDKLYQFDDHDLNNIFMKN
jgi:hypothetical protein